LGPFDVVQAVDAPLRAGTFQPVLMSHGLFGRARNHHLTAQALADAGFIAIAPVHAADHYIDTEKRAAALAWRFTELRHAVELVIRDEDFRDSMDLSVIHGVGYSLGTASILMGAGAGLILGLLMSIARLRMTPAFAKDRDSSRDGRSTAHAVWRFMSRTGRFPTGSSRCLSSMVALP